MMETGRASRNFSIRDSKRSQGVPFTVPLTAPGQVEISEGIGGIIFLTKKRFRLKRKIFGGSHFCCLIPNAGRASKNIFGLRSGDQTLLLGQIKFFTLGTFGEH